MPGVRPIARGRFEAALERLLVPATVSLDGRSDDFRRVVGLVAGLAVGLFVPALLLAGVPPEKWLPFTAMAAMAGILVGTSISVVARDSAAGWVAAAGNAITVAALGHLLHPYFNQIGLLYMLVVSAHAVIHGLRPALLAAAMGSVLVPYVIASGIGMNPSDVLYAFIYLSGAAIVPWTAERLAHRRSVALREQLALTIATEREAVLILARAAEAKDVVTGDHVVRVGDISADLGARVGMTADEIEDLRYAGMLHDVGKLHVPDRILLKPGPLDREEWEVVKRHTIWGERILGSSEGFALARVICRSHHENWDGSGYPDGLRRDTIPLAARIVRLADTFDALRNPRSYKEAWTLERSLELLERGAGELFDPELVRELLALYASAEMAVAWPRAQADADVHMRGSLSLRT